MAVRAGALLAYAGRYKVNNMVSSLNRYDAPVRERCVCVKLLPSSCVGRQPAFDFLFLVPVFVFVLSGLKRGGLVAFLVLLFYDNA